VLLKVVDGQPRCPAHGSRFDVNGKPTKGPADKALPRYAVQINTQKHLVIDTTQTFDSSRWSDAAASVAAE
jgi:Rieske Fe-S protein